MRRPRPLPPGPRKCFDCPRRIPIGAPSSRKVCERCRRRRDIEAAKRSNQARDAKNGEHVPELARTFDGAISESHGGRD